MTAPFYSPKATISVFSGIRITFYFVDRSELWHCLLGKGVSEKYASALKRLFCNTSGRVTVYGQLLAPFDVSIGVRLGCPVSSFIFKFVIEYVSQEAFSSLMGSGVEFLYVNGVFDIFDHFVFYFFH